MSTYDTRHDKSRGYRPTHIVLGTDAAGATHHYHTPTETVHVVRDGTREHVELLCGRPVDEWIMFVREVRGWADRQYGLGIADLVERALGEGA